MVNKDTHPIKWNLKLANWSQYSEVIAEKLDITKTHTHASDMVSYLTALMKEAADVAVGRLWPPKSDHRTVPWWNKQCEQAIKESKSAFNLVKRHNTVENLINFKRLRANAKRIVKESKRAAWQRYVASTSADTCLSDVWNRVRRIKGLSNHFQIPGLLENDNYVTSGHEKATLFARHFETNSSTYNYPPKFLHHKEEQEKHNLELNDISDTPINNAITLNELEDALKTISKPSRPRRYTLQFPITFT